MTLRSPRPDMPAPATLLDLLEQRVPDADCLFTFLKDGERDEQTLAAAAVHRAALGVAESLAGRVDPGERVAICCPPGNEYVVALFGALAAGAIVVPAYPPDPVRARRTLPLLAGIIADSRPRVLLTTPGVEPLVRATLAAETVTVTVPGAAPEMGTGTISAAAQNGACPHFGGDARRAGDVAILMYTSGSTGSPKGVMVTHRSLLHNLRMFPGLDTRPPRVFVSWLPFYHDLGLMFGILLPLLHGVRSVTMPPLAFIERPVRWLEAISRFRATTTAGPDFAYRLSVDRTNAAERAALDLRSWDLALNGAEPVRADTIERFSAAYACAGFRRDTFFPSYGLADATAAVSGGGDSPEPLIRAVDADQLERGTIAEPTGEDRRLLVGCGRSLPDQRIVIVDPDTREELPPDRVGEVWVSGPSIASGYWNRASESLATFGARTRTDSGTRYLRTGDLGFVWKDQLFITGRLKDVIVVHGDNHYPQDLETTVEGCHVALRGGCSAAFSIDAGGEERVVIVAEVRGAARGAAREIIGAIREAIADAHGLETHAIVLVGPSTIPKTSSGKVRRRPCRSDFLEGRLDVVAEWRGGLPHESPREDRGAGALRAQRVPARRHDLATAIEQRLIARFANRLALSPESIDVHQPFVHWGVTSIEAVAIAADLERWLDRALAATLLWEHPTIARLAAHLAASASLADSAPEPSRAAPAPDGEPIAIVGLGCRFPGAPDADAYWKLLCDGAHAIVEIPPDRWDVREYYDPDPGAPGRSTSRWGGFLERIDCWDPSFFGVGAREAPHVDPRQRLVLELAWEALEDAGIPPHSLAGSTTGVYVATLTDDYHDTGYNDPTRLEAFAGPGTAGSIVANRVSYFLDLRGPSLMVDTACSGSLVSLHLACQAIRSGECTLALAGGVNVILRPDGHIFFSKAGALSPDGRCRPFDRGANGIVRSEGAGIVVLKSLSAALRDRDRVYAIVRGSAVNQDGRTSGLMAPNRQAQVDVVREAYRRAGVAAHDIQYVEAHGTGTRLGDPIEAQALGDVLREGRDAANRCALGSVKGNVGHLEAAAGIAGIIKVALAMRHRQLPPTAGFERANPLIPFETLPLVVQQALGPWPQPARPLLAGVSSFGFGGTNAHVVLEEAPVPHAARPSTVDVDGPVVLPLSARSRAALHARARAWHEWIVLHPDVPLEDVAFTAGVRRTHLDHRLAIAARTRGGLIEALAAAASGGDHRALAAGVRPSSRPPKLAFAFAGEDALSIGMGVELIDAEPVFAATIARCDRVFRDHVDWSLGDELRRSGRALGSGRREVVHAAVFAIEVALAELWRSWGVGPQLVTGEGVGEVAAAHVAGALDLEAAATLVLNRSRGTRVERLTPRSTLIQFVSGVTGLETRGDALDAGYWMPAARGSVEAALRHSIEAGCETIVEVGPRPVLGRVIDDVVAASGRPINVFASTREASDRLALRETVAHLYVLGYPVKWSEIQGPMRPPVPLPAYPWQRERHWFDQVRSGAARPRAAADAATRRHPFLGAPIEIAGDERRVAWPVDVSALSMEYVDAQRAGGAVALPDAAWIEMMVAALGADVSERVLADVEFDRPLLLSARDGLRVQMVFTAGGGGEGELACYSAVADADPPDWTLHARGRVCRAADATAPVGSITRAGSPRTL